MKMILILLNILFVLLLIAAPALKNINRARLFTLIILLLYTIGIVKLVVLYPIPCLALLGGGLLTFLSIAFLFRQNSTRDERKAVDHKMQIPDWQHGARIKGRGISSFHLTHSPS